MLDNLSAHPRSVGSGH